MATGQLWLFPPPKPLVDRLGEDFFRQLPSGPGVYLMCGAQEGVLYVGKARNLRRRLSSYLVAHPDRLPRRIIRLLYRVNCEVRSPRCEVRPVRQSTFGIHHFLRLWIQVLYSALNPKGRAGFVMANSASDARSSEQELRRQLIESRAVDVMVAVRNRIQPVMNAELTLILFPNTLAPDG